MNPVVAASADSITESNTSVEVTVSPTVPVGWDEYVSCHGMAGFPWDSRWVESVSRGLNHPAHYFIALRRQTIVGVLPCIAMRTRLFGRHVVSLPYVNTGGVLAEEVDIEARLIDAAVQLANRFQAKQLQLRHEKVSDHRAFSTLGNTKVHMRLSLPSTIDELWESFKSKRRSQIRKPLNNLELQEGWGREELLHEFYQVFTRNMRDLGTPPYSPRLFSAILEQFGDAAEFCVVRHHGVPVAAAMLVHGPGITLVPSASTLREANPLAVNMRMYWHLLCRSIDRGQRVFDFGRSTRDSGPWRFKKQWGAEETDANWQSVVFRGAGDQLRPDNQKFSLMIRAWQKLPVCVTRWIGPSIVRGIP